MSSTPKTSSALTEDGRNWLWATRITALASFLIIIAAAYDAEPETLIGLFPFLGWYFIILLGTCRTPSRTALRLARGIGIFGFLVGLLLFLGAGGAERIPLVVFALTQGALLVSASKMLFTMKHFTGASSRWWDGVIRAGSVLCASLLLFALFLFTSTGLLSIARAARESSALSGVKKINDCAASFAQAHSEQGYPRSLSAMGPAGTGCLNKEAVGGQKNGYKFHYAPGPPDATGRIATYSITAGPMRYGSSGSRSFFSDESGHIHYTYEDRPATAEDPEVENP